MAAFQGYTRKSFTKCVQDVTHQVKICFECTQKPIFLRMSSIEIFRKSEFTVQRLWFVRLTKITGEWNNIIIEGSLKLRSICVWFRDQIETRTQDK